MNSEEFTNDFINSIRDDRTARFQTVYRDVDVLLIDDIQFLAGKVQTQEEFFHTFNALHNATKQVVITSDLPPKQLSGFEERLRSRFEWGLICDVQPPDLETRIAILRKKATLERMSTPDDVLEYIASKISSNIRELEGALIRVTAFANLNRQPVTLDLAEVVLHDLIPSEQPAQITVSTIMGETARYFGLTIDDLCSSSRSRQLVQARQIAMYLCRELTELSLPKIGQHFGGRDHTTVMHADRKIRELMGERRAIYNQVTELTNRIKQQSTTVALSPRPTRRVVHRPSRMRRAGFATKSPGFSTACGQLCGPTAGGSIGMASSARTSAPTPGVSTAPVDDRGTTAPRPVRPAQPRRTDAWGRVPPSSTGRPSCPQLVHRAVHTAGRPLTCADAGCPPCPHPR